jgi:hypothetical protein
VHGSTMTTEIDLILVLEQFFVLGVTAVCAVSLPLLLFLIANHGKRRIKP